MKCHVTRCFFLRVLRGRAYSLSLSLSRCQVMKSMAAKGRKLISGDAGAKLMQELTPTSGMSSRGG